jgi:nicotinate-nucleotide adenylyltransferase
MKIGIFGGAFNPIHYGHLRTAEEVFEILSLDKVFFIPSGNPPFKKPELAKACHRYEMVKAAIEDNPHFKLSNIEMKTRGKSYSVDTITKLSNRYKKSEFFFILGIDAFLDLPSWKHPQRLIKLTNFVVISRPGYSFTDLSSSPYLVNVPKKILKELDKGIITKFSFPLPSGQRCFLCKVTGFNISASRIRSLIMTGKDIKYLLPDSVKSYIISHKLYLKSGK